MLAWVEQAFVERDEKRFPLITPAWEAREDCKRVIHYRVPDHCHSLLIHVQIYRNLTFLSLMRAISHYRCQNENQKRTNGTSATFVKRSESKCIQDNITKQGNIASNIMLNN